MGVILYELLTGELPFNIANSSDPDFIRFEETGFQVIRYLLDNVHADPQAVGRNNGSR